MTLEVVGGGLQAMVNVKGLHLARGDVTGQPQQSGGIGAATEGNRQGMGGFGCSGQRARAGGFGR